MLSLTVFLTTIAYALLGIVIFAVGFIVWDKLTPLDLWKELCEKQNVALAIVAGSMAIGLSIVIAAAIHG